MIKPNNIYHGDCYELIKQISDNSVDLVITDPPYQIDGLHTGTGIFKDRKHKQHYINEMRSTNLDKGINIDILDELCRVLKYIYIYMVQQRTNI